MAARSLLALLLVRGMGWAGVGVRHWLDFSPPALQPPTFSTRVRQPAEVTFLAAWCGREDCDVGLLLRSAWEPVFRLSGLGLGAD